MNIAEFLLPGMFRKIAKKFLLGSLVAPLAYKLSDNLELMINYDGASSHSRRRAGKYKFLWDAKEFARTNDMEGDYYEFGVNNCRTFIKAMKIMPPFVKHYYGFDSFKGLPAFKDGDEHPGWFEGSMKTRGDAKYFEEYFCAEGFDKNNFTLMEGFFEETLPRFNPPRKANAVFIDCDLISSLETVLAFLPKILQDGTLVYLDDWFCYRGNPNGGQQKVWADFCRRQKDFKFSEYATYPPLARVFVASKQV